MNTMQDERSAVKKAEYEIEIAFCDRADKPPPDWETRRRLFFLSTVLLTPKEAQSLLAQYVGRCEMFFPESLSHLPHNCMVRIGREYSVCIYVTTPQPLHKNLEAKMKADEFRLHQSIGQHGHHVYRFWWD